MMMMMICQLIKLGANRSRVNRNTFFCVFFEMAAATTCYSRKVLFWTPIHLYCPYLSAYQICYNEVDYQYVRCLTNERKHDCKML